jgi:hypothetical protein
MSDEALAAPLAGAVSRMGRGEGTGTTEAARLRGAGEIKGEAPPASREG